MTSISHALRLTVVTLGLCATPACVAVDLGLQENELPVVLTPTRLRQSLADVPASVTIITAEMIKRYGILSIPEALRLVPGMAVTQVTGNDYRIGYHGTNILVPRRMNVLIDGMSVYRPAFARVDWKELPVAIEDVERIEVTRGPDSVSYGANSMLAIVNIITKHPGETDGTLLVSTVGTQQIAGDTARHGGRLGDATAYRVTVDYERDGGFDYASTLGQGHDSTRVKRLGFRSVTEMGSDQTLDLQANLLSGVKEIEFNDRFQQGFPDVDVRDYDVNGHWRKSFSPGHELQIQAYATRHDYDQAWRDCLPTLMLLPQLGELWRANPSYVNAVLAGKTPSGGTPTDNALAAAVIWAYRALGSRAAIPTCANTNQNYAESRYDMELQDTFVFSDALRMVSGLGARRDIGTSQTYLQGTFSNNSWRVFSNVEYRPNVAMNINVGGFVERDQLTGSVFSPRIALNEHLTPNQTIRFVLSKAVRMPDILEQRANWRYRGTDYDVPINGATEGYFYASARSPGTVGSEEILSREIGYVGNFPTYGLLVDAKIFDDRLSDLVSQKLQVFDFNPTNTNWAHSRGGELQATYEPNHQWMMYVSYAYLDNDTSTVVEQTQYSRHSGAFGISRKWADGWRGTLAYYGYSGNTAGQQFYGREDFTIAKDHRFQRDFHLTTSFSIRHLENRSTSYFVDFGQTRESRYDRAMQYYVTAKLSF